MNYLDDLAREIARRVPPDIVPDDGSQSLFRLYAVLALAKGTAVQAADVHDAWAAWMCDRDPQHRSLRPFDELAPETQAADEPFVCAIRAAAAAAASPSPPRR